MLGSVEDALPSGSRDRSDATGFDLSQLKDVGHEKYDENRSVKADSDVSDNLDVLSEVSDNSDLFHVSAVLSEEPRSEEDADIRICRAIASHLRDFPLLPPDGRDAEKNHSFRDVQGCIAFPLLHCGFKGCGWSFNGDPEYHWHHERHLGIHLHAAHSSREMASVPEAAWELKKEGKGNKHRPTLDAIAYYQAAVEMKEQEHIPIIGPSIDRRMLRIMTKLLNSNTVQGLVCLGCANVRTFVKSWPNITGITGSNNQ